MTWLYFVFVQSVFGFVVSDPCHGGTQRDSEPAPMCLEGHLQQLPSLDSPLLGEAAAAAAAAGNAAADDGAADYESADTIVNAVAAAAVAYA
jgi:hypothetical protein